VSLVANKAEAEEGGRSWGNR